MKFAVLSDIHSNVEALVAVFLDLYKNNEKIDTLLITGDIVGYGPNPNECCSIAMFLQKGQEQLKSEIETIIQNLDIDADDRKSAIEYILSMRKKAFVIVGNHDKEIIGQPSYVSMMAPAANKAAKWTTSILKKENFKYLSSLKFRTKLRSFGIELVHSTPVYPRGWEYPKNAGVLSYNTLMANITFAGHTHSPASYLYYKNQNTDKPVSVLIAVDQFDNRLMMIEKSTSQRVEEFDINLNSGHKYYINPGSVGQPRDGIPKASYMIYDTETQKVSLKKAEFNTEVVKEKIIKAKLPRELANRVIKGV